MGIHLIRAGLLMLGLSVFASATITRTKLADKELVELSASQAAQQIRSGQLSSRRLVRALARRIETHGYLNAFTPLTSIGRYVRQNEPITA